MKCAHIPVREGNKTVTLHVMTDNIEALVPMVLGGLPGTEVCMVSGKVLRSTLDLETVLKRIDEAHIRHTQDGDE